jgi:branched-chain amino acid transport system ATP-binding protein
LLKVEQVSIFYDSIQAIWDATLLARAHALTAIVGSNGAGKTAMMKMIAGILSNSGGRILFRGEVIDSIPPHRRVEMGIALVPEGRKVFPYLSVQENLDIGAYNKQARKGLSKKLDEIYELFPALQTRKKQMAVSLSGGEQQMLAIGRGLMSRPSLLMMDEPSLGLAPIIVKLVFATMEKIRAAGVTILLVEQNVRQTLLHAETAYILETGKITMEGRGVDLLGNPHVKKAYLGL